jgi:hypothetical protein
MNKISKQLLTFQDGLWFGDLNRYFPVFFTYGKDMRTRETEVFQWKPLVIFCLEMKPILQWELKIYATVHTNIQPSEKFSVVYETEIKLGSYINNNGPIFN